MKNPKEKGNSFERKIANLLSARFKAVTGVTTGFRRNGDSGSYFGGLNRSRVATHALDKATFGDIIVPANFRFTIECKHYKSPPVFNAIVNEAIADWDKWIGQATEDAAKAGAAPMLIIKYNRVDEIVLLSEQIAQFRALPYKNMLVYKLADVLALPDEWFFTAAGPRSST